MRLRYRPDGDRLWLEVDDRVEDETRVWKMLERWGVPVQRDATSKALLAPRFVPREALPKLEKACRMLRFTLSPMAGAPRVVSASGPGAAYAKARPLDPVTVIEAAIRDPEGARPALRDARIRLAAWVREHPTFRREAEADIEALAAALDRLDARDNEKAKAAASERSAELAQMIRGVSGDDAFRAHQALKRLDETAQRTEAASGVEPDAAVEVPSRIPGFLGRLRPYQRDGVEFLVRRRHTAILADEMGLGKTVMAIAAVQAVAGRAVVVGPANVLYNWAEEIDRFTGTPPQVFHRQQLAGPSDSPWLITTYDSLRNLPPDHSSLTSRSILVLDEAHYVRNPETQRNRLVRALPQKQRILLTGTPLVNGIEDYYELLREVGVTPWGSRQAFRDAWVVDASLWDRYAQVRNATARLLHRVTAHVLLRRRKEDVLTELPPRTIKVMPEELDERGQREYLQLEAKAREALEKAHGEAAVFSALHSLRHFLAKARAQPIAERVAELVEAGESVVVYSQYLEPLRMVQRAVPQARLLEGSTPPRERLALAKALGSGELKVLLAQMDAGGIGLNFTGARFVLFLHLGWTPSGHAQAMDRVHRIGQDRPVLVEFYVTPGTVDERLARILLRKEADQNLVLADDSDVMNRAELMRTLLTPRPPQE